MSLEIVLIAAVARNGVIGNKGELPWKISEDLKRFKELTLGGAVIMGRKTYDSILARIGEPLPERLNIVITSQNFREEGVVVVHSVEEALIAVKGFEKVFVIGGQSIYRGFINRKLIDRMELTVIDEDFDGDAFFPKVDWGDWKEIERIKGEEGRYSFVSYVRSENL